MCRYLLDDLEFAGKYLYRACMNILHVQLSINFDPLFIFVLEQKFSNFHWLVSNLFCAFLYNGVYFISIIIVLPPPTPNLTLLSAQHLPPPPESSSAERE